MCHLTEKIFNSGKALMHIYSHTKFQLSNLIISQDMRGVPKSKMASRFAHAPPSGKFPTLLKLLIISIHLPNFSFLTQLLPEIWSPLFPIGLTLRGPRNGFLGVLNMVGVNILNLSSL